VEHRRFGRRSLRVRVGVRAIVFAVLVTCGLIAPVGALETQEPPGFERILPRGRIAAVVEPTYVPASEAKLAPSTWVLGVVIDSQPRAYSLNLLNAHEVVNDTIGDTNFAAVW
jgi:hypothetical protein